MAFGVARSGMDVFDRQCGCPRPERAEYRASAAEIDRMRRWFAEHWAPVSEEFARWALNSVAEVAAGGVARTCFEGKDGVVATITPEVARLIIAQDP